MPIISKVFHRIELICFVKCLLSCMFNIAERNLTSPTSTRLICRSEKVLFIIQLVEFTVICTFYNQVCEKVIIKERDGVYNPLAWYIHSMVMIKIMGQIEVKMYLSFS